MYIRSPVYVRCFVKKQDLLVVVGHHVIVVVVGGDSFKVERQRTDTIPACGAAQAGKHLGPRTCKTLVQKMVISLSQHGITTRSKAAVVTVILDVQAARILCCDVSGQHT